jgi:hypothetical protein
VEEVEEEEDEDEEKEEEDEEEENNEDFKAVSRTCDGALNRLFHEQKTGLWEKNANGNAKYHDISYPADMSSLYWNESNKSKNNTSLRGLWNNNIFKWKRPTEIEASPSLWGSKGIRPSAINQGVLGDCWFLSTMSALGEWPERVKAVFKNAEYTDKASKNGIFELNMYMYGEPLKVVVDDRLPMIGTTN